MLEFHLIANSKWFLSPLVGNGFHIVEEKYFIFFPHFACKSATPNSEKIENKENQRFFHDTGESSVLHERFLVLKVADDIFFPFFFFFTQEILEVDIEDEKQLDDSPENF